MDNLALKKLYLCLIGVLCLLTANHLYAQKFSFGDVYNRTTFLKEMSAGDDVEGSPYIQSEFVPAKIAGSEILYSVRYNAFSDQIEVKKDGETLALPAIYGYTVELSPSGKVYQVYGAKEEPEGFFVVLSEGENFKLLEKERIKYEEAVESNGIELYKPPQFKKEKSKFYIGYKNNTASRLPSKKKEFYALFGKESKTIASYVKENKLSIKKQEDLIQIINYYNTL